MEDLLKRELKKRLDAHQKDCENLVVQFFKKNPEADPTKLRIVYETVGTTYVTRLEYDCGS